MIQSGTGRQGSACAAGARAIVFVLLVLLAGCSDDTSSPPVLHLSPALIHLAPGDSSGTFTVSNAGQGTITWQLEDDAPWLTLEPRQGTTATAQAVACTVVPESLRLGPQEATVAVTSNGGSGQVRVRMTSAFGLDPATIDLGDTTRAAPIVIGMAGAAPDTLWWTTSASDAWLSVAPDAGFRCDRPETLTVSVDRAHLAAGAYVGWVIVDGGAFGRDSASVALTVPQRAGVLGIVYFESTRIPAAGVEVRIDAVRDTTDGEGRYVLPGVPVGEHHLRAGREGFDDYDAAVQVGETGLRADFEMRSTTYTHTVSGTATNRAERGTGSVLVTLVNPDSSPSGIHALTATDGTFALHGVPEGEHRLRWTSYLYETLISYVTVSGDVTHDVRLRAKPLDPPYLPVGPGLRQIDCAAVRVSWAPRHEETVGGYRVERSTYVGSIFEDVSGFVAAPLDSFDDRGARLDGHRYLVRTENIDGVIGEPSNEAALRMADWILLNDGEHGPAERWGHVAIYDPPAQRMVIYGGLSCIDESCGQLSAETWALDLTSFAWDTLDVGTGPSERQDHRAIYDPARRRMVVFGGRDVTSIFNDTWAFDLAAQTWTLLDDGSAGPPPRYACAIAYDEATDRMIVYGGGSERGALNDVWAFHLGTSAWERLRSGEYGEQDPQPEGRQFPGAVLDPARRRMIVYGGFTYTQTSPRADAWALDLATATWEPRRDGPSPCFGQAGMYDALHDRAIFYGGGIGEGQYTDAMAALDLGHEGTWNEIDDGPAGTGPGKRFYQTVIEDPVREGLILFGGHQGTALAKDAWVYCLAD